MAMKKLILYGITIFFSIILLIYLIVFTSKVLNSRDVYDDESDTNLVTNTKDIEVMPDDDAPFKDHISQDMNDINSETDDTSANIDGLDSNDVLVEKDRHPEDDELEEDIESENTTQNGAISEQIDDIEDPQHENSEGIIVDLEDVDKPKDETDAITYGIDVAKWQGVIDWAKVKEAEVEFAMIRVGYRTLIDGKITEDPYAKYNLQEAQKHGIKIGAYFFSTAVNKKEAEEEAKWVTKFIAPYKITYPVVYNCEGFTVSNNRQYTLSKDERTSLPIVFLDYIKEKGYTPMFYASKNELENSRDWDTDSLTKKYKIWVAQYPDTVNTNSKSSYSYDHVMWQYTSNGRVPGIKGSVDLNIAYFGYENEAKPKDDTPAKEVVADPLALTNFKEVSETVTAKEVTNLRDIPGLDKDSKVIAVLHYGDTAKRTGIGDNGWSKVEYKGKTLYAVTTYLTTDLDYKKDSKPSIENPEEGITFTKANEKVTAKMVTNLRLVPSTDSDETIVTSLEKGQIAIRTGIGSNGWSRVEYEEQVLYAVTNYLELVKED